MIKKYILSTVAIAIVATGIFIYGKYETSPRPKTKGSTENNTSSHVRSLHIDSTQADFAVKSPEKLELTPQALLDAKLDLDVAKRLLERCENEIPDLQKRSIMCGAIIGALCRQGLVSEAWSLITSNPGSIRIGKIHSFFSNTEATSLSDVSEYLAQLESPQDRRIALCSLLQGRPEAVLDLEPSEIFGATAQEQMGIVAGLSMALQFKSNLEIEGVLIDRLIQLTASGKLDPVGFLNIAQNSSTIDSFASWEMLKTHTKSFDQKSLEKVQSSLVKNMMNSSPDQAMDIICSDPSTKYSYPILSAAIQKFYDVSQNDANDWITTNMDKLDPTTSQQIISVVSQQANRGDEFETARQWANRILNAEVRQQLLDQVNMREAEKTKQPTR